MHDPPESAAAGSRLSRSAFLGSGALLLLAADPASAATTSDAALSPELAAHDADPAAHPPLRARLDAIDSGAPPSAWAPSTAYSARQRVTQGGNVYAAKVAFTSGATFNAADWDLVGAAAFWQWAKRSSLRLDDFAPGDGVIDAGPGLQAALDALGAQGKTELVVGKGKFRIATSVAKNFTNVTPSLRLRGDGSASQIVFDTGSVDTLTLSNLFDLAIEDVYFVGVPANAADTKRGLSMLSIEQATLRGCGFYGLRSATPGGAVVAFDGNTTGSALRVKECRFRGSTGHSGQGVSVLDVHHWRTFHMEDTEFIDHGRLDNVDHVRPNLSSAFAWVALRDCVSGAHAFAQARANLERVVFDEGTLFGLNVGANENTSPRPDLIRIRDMSINGGGASSSIGVRVRYASKVDIDGLWVGYQTADPVRDAVLLLDARRATLRRVRAEQKFSRITADAATYIDIDPADCVYTTLVAPNSNQWVAPTLESGWTNVGGGWTLAGYRKDAAGTVSLRGLVTGPVTAGSTIFTLPVGYRPVRNAGPMPARTNGSAGEVRILSSGEVQSMVNRASLSLDPVEFSSL